MCGFAGTINSADLIERAGLAEVAGAVSFRGPDRCRLKIFNEDWEEHDAGVNALFFNRLAILDIEERSDQPFENDEYILSFNGEIYNYASLKERLTKLGYFFKTTSDTEVLFYALQEWGKDALPLLNGMFAFCFINKKKRSVLLARDRVGIKPMYYTREGGQLLFSSELDTILRMLKRQPRINREAIQMFLWMQFIPTPFSVVNDVLKLPPGHYLETSWQELRDRKELNPVPYWDAYELNSKVGESDPAQLEKVLTESLSRQLIADVPLGLFLSSGVDSSLLAALVNKHFATSQAFDFFTVAFTEQTLSDESKDATHFINGFKNPRLRSHHLTVDPAFVQQHLEKFFAYFDEPFGDSTALLNWVISKKAKEHVTVALSGDGADELFWGYRRYEQWQHPSITLFDKYKLPQAMASVAKPFLGEGYLGSKALLEMEPDPVKRHFTLFLHPALKQLLENPVWEKPIWALKGIDKISCRNQLAAILDIKTYLSDAMLHKVDRASMAASLEVRVPYLDNKVIDYAIGLPFRQKSNEIFRFKAILKELLQQIAPHYDVHRPKKGFNFPIDQWLRFKWRDLALSHLSKEGIDDLGLDGKWFMKMVNDYYGGEIKYCIPVWYLLNLMLWKRKFDQLTSGKI